VKTAGFSISCRKKKRRYKMKKEIEVWGNNSPYTKGIKRRII